jgi:hypothetical protein
VASIHVPDCILYPGMQVHEAEVVL